MSTERKPRFAELLRDAPVIGSDPRLRVVTSAGEMASLRFRADLLVVDGGLYSDAELDTADAGTVVLVEGRRNRVRAMLEHNLRHRSLEVRYREVRRRRWPEKVELRLLLELPPRAAWRVRYDKCGYVGTVSGAA